MGTILKDEDIKIIHQNSIEILEDVGVRIDHNSVLQRLADSGCSVDFDKNIAKIPEELINKCLSLCPSTIKIGDRTWDTIDVGPDGGNIFWSGNALYIVDGKERREFTKEIFIQLVKVLDGLSEVNGVVGVSLSDIPPAVRDIVGFRLMGEYTNKHLRPCIYSPENAEGIRHMSEVLLDGRRYEDSPIYSLGYSICSPLHWTKIASELFIISAGYSVPVTINSEIMLGGSSPVTIAGGLSLGNAEVLSGIVINQLFEEGRPVIYNLGFSHVLDMRTSVALSGAPECGLMAAAGADLAKHYNLPSASWMSTDSLFTDSQAGFEHMMLAHAFMTSGVNIIWGVGQIERQLSLSLKQAVIDNDIITYIKRYCRGIDVNQETLALDIIKKVGISGEYLTNEHTMRNFKKELSFGETVCRNRRESSKQDGGLSIEEKAAEKIDKILDKQKTYISDNQKKELDLIEKLWLKKYGY